MSKSPEMYPLTEFFFAIREAYMKGLSLNVAIANELTLTGTGRLQGIREACFELNRMAEAELAARQEGEDQ